MTLAQDATAEPGVGEKFSVERILWVRPWAPNLFSFALTRNPAFRFAPGQFARLGVTVANPDANPDAEPRKNPGGEKIVWRAYSVVSSAADATLEFYSILLPQGEFSSSLARCRVGDPVLVEKTNYGFLTLDRFAGGRDLWLLATGTGLAPFLSILQDGATWQQYENVILVHSVRYGNELAYADAIAAVQARAQAHSPSRRLFYVATVTGPAAPRAAPATLDAPVLRARIPALLQSGELESMLSVPLDLQRSRIMICGNPAMIEVTRKLLAARGFVRSRRAAPGHIAVENYW